MARRGKQKLIAKIHNLLKVANIGCFFAIFMFAVISFWINYFHEKGKHFTGVEYNCFVR